MKDNISISWRLFKRAFKCSKNDSRRFSRLCQFVWFVPWTKCFRFCFRIRKTISEDKECEYIILSDLYGASVCTAMLRLTNLHNVRLFSGMNLNMVLELLTRFLMN